MTRKTLHSLAVAWLVGTSGGLAIAGNPNDWPMYGHDSRRTAFNPNETKINRSSVAFLAPKWVFRAGDSITASPVVINFEHFGPTGTEPPRKVVYVGSADAKFYAIDAATGTEIWHFDADPAPGIAYNMFVSSAFVDLDRHQLYVGGGFTMYALDLYAGTANWRWSTANNGGGEIESSPVIVDGKVFFGSDLDGSIATVSPKYPALFALDAALGTLQWYWRPSLIGTCGDVWCSVAVDEAARLLYFGTSDCGGSHQGLYNEALIALAMDAPTDGRFNSETRQRSDDPAWYFQPRDIDPYDYDFGATPLLFDGPDGTKYVGIGGKDGAFYVTRREAMPAGFRDTIWSQRVVRGGFAGGFIGSSATDGRKIWGATALLDTPPGPNPIIQPPFMHSFDALSGDIAWQQLTTGPTFAATTAVPGVVFVGGVDGIVQALDSETGQLLWLFPVIGAVSSGGAISDGEFFIGAGTTSAAYGLGEGPLNGLFAFSLLPVPPIAGFPPSLPPATWPLGVLQMPGFPDESTPATTPTPN